MTRMMTMTMKTKLGKRMVWTRDECGKTLSRHLRRREYFENRDTRLSKDKSELMVLIQSVSRGSITVMHISPMRCEYYVFTGSSTPPQFHLLRNSPEFQDISITTYMVQNNKRVSEK